ncbi:MAG TPA: YebC/PmpR family DNA-binding transcriptional regulator [Syntrophomonadaceae bacterium]|nr:YebC/PmpR family DNA-binding transcriptional regulator [Syntrophomonadaceae bacterium]
MAGHSKWSNIKHKKARMDEKRGKEYTKLAKELTIAARMGGGDPEMNSKLKLTIQKAKEINMPNDNINRAIKKGTGELESETYEEFIYEGYAPGGVAVILEIATDNRNRTASDIRHLFSKHGGNLGETGCVAWMFDRVGLVTVSSEKLADVDEFMLTALELGADDVREDEDLLEIISSVEDFMDLRDAIEKVATIEDADMVYLPKNIVEVNDEDTAMKVMKLIDVLEDHDDVQNVYANFSIPDEIMDKFE